MGCFDFVIRWNGRFLYIFKECVDSLDFAVLWRDRRVLRIYDFVSFGRNSYEKIGHLRSLVL